MKTISLLIADDEPSIGEGLLHAIPWEDFGIEILGVAYDGEQAMEWIRTRHPDIVMTDIRMPKCDGISMIRQARDEKLSTYFIILSAYDDFKYTQKAIEYGVTSYLLKPIQTDELIRTVRHIRTLIEKNEQRLTQVSEMAHKAAVASEAMHDKFFSNLIHGEYGCESDVEQNLRELGVPVQNGPARVILFEYESNLPQAGSLRHDSLIRKAAVKNIVDEIFTVPHVSFNQSQNRIALLFNSGGDDGPVLRQMCQLCIDKIEEYLHLPAFAGIGARTDRLLGVDESFRSARDAISYRLYELPQSVFDSSDIFFQTSNMSLHDFKSDGIVNAILVGNQDELRVQIEKFFQVLFYIQMPPPSFVQGMCGYMLMDVQKKLSVYLNGTFVLTDQLPQETVNSFHTLRELKEWVAQTLLSYIDYMRRHGNMRDDPVIQQAKSYITEHIGKKIRLEDVASFVHLSPNYFATYFKQKTNEKFRNYVLNLKIQYATKLLTSSQKSISEISAMLGYDDYRSFLRVFKNATGKRPSEIYDMYHK